jgi:hypothetical protein
VMLFEAEPDMSSSDNMPDLHREHSHTWGSLVPPNRRPMQDFSEKCLVMCMSMSMCMCVHLCMRVHACEHEHVHACMHMCRHMCLA